MMLACLTWSSAEAQQHPVFHVEKTPQTTTQATKMAEAIEQVSKNSEEFSLEFLKLLSRAVTPVNYDFIVSPFSIWSLLVLQAEGAAGNTYAQLKKVLRLPEDLTYLRMAYKQIQKSLDVNASTVEVAVNQALFSDQNRPVDPEYASKLDNIYEADHLPVDFYNSLDTFSRINKYVSDKTQGRIPRIVNLDDLNEAQMILISAIFFKGQWKVRIRDAVSENLDYNWYDCLFYSISQMPFNRSYTTEEQFFDEFGNLVGNVNMMFQRGPFSYTAIAELESHVLELPYGKEDRLSMIILLPRKQVQLPSVMDRLFNYGITRILNELRRADAEYEEDEVEVFLPRFSITADFTLNVILEQMGLSDIFDANRANLSGISKHSIYLSRIIHKAKIDVNEVGTVATAASGAIFANKATPPRFYANRPFAFLIVEKQTKTLLFGGQVRNPGKVEYKDL